MNKTNQEVKNNVKTYFYPNIYYLISIYVMGVILAVTLNPFGRASTDAVLLTGFASLSILIISLVAGPVAEVKTIENKWLRDAAASSFVTVMIALFLATIILMQHFISTELALLSVMTVATFDFIGKLIIAKKRDS